MSYAGFFETSGGLDQQTYIPKYCAFVIFEMTLWKFLIICCIFLYGVIYSTVWENS